MDAKEARRITDEANRPYTLDYVEAEIAYRARTGECKRTFEARRWAQSLTEALVAKGFKVTVTSLAGDSYVNVEW